MVTGQVREESVVRGQGQGARGHVKEETMVRGQGQGCPW